MFKHVLVAIDGSAYSRQALPTAIEVASKFGADLLVLHVAEHDRGRAAVYSIETPAEATRLVADAVSEAMAAGLTAHGALVDKAAGHVARAIEEATAEHGIDLIVMGSRGLSDAQGFFLGSVTHKVMQMVDVPVLVTRDAKAVIDRELVGAVGPAHKGS
jgi:nucleotide-binding universal stress UspA family protein